MLRIVRHKLRMIRYYSARRTQTAWSRAFDIAVIASLILALPAVWLFDSMVVRPTLAIDLPGLLRQNGQAPITAQLLIEDRPPTGDTTSRPAGTFHLRVEDHYCGWPLTTSIRRQPAQVSIDLLSEPKPRTHAPLDEADPAATAIAAALEDAQELQAINAWRAAGPVLSQIWGGWSGNAALWWVMLALASGVAITIVRFTSKILTMIMKSRRAYLRAQNKCLECGYDLTGLEFNERCPECGKLAW